MATGEWDGVSWPAWKGSRRAQILRKVDLPEPFSPVRRMIWPRLAVKLACEKMVLEAYDLVRFLTLKVSILFFLPLGGLWVGGGLELRV